MPIVTRRSIASFIVLLLATLLVLGLFIWSGIYNVGADDEHTRPMHSVLQTLRERSIAARAGKLEVPDLADPARIRQGAGNYDAMCMGCHLAPGMADTELSKGLYPAPPNLSQATVDAAAAFWVIKHGIKASGMPAWGKSMEDGYIWNMVAFLQQLPRLDAAQYQALVASSGGHEHGGGETIEHAHAEDMPADAPAAPKPHAHPPGTPADHHDTPATPEPKPEAASVEHRHADGTVESHPAPQPTQAGDGHDHQH